MPPENQPRRSAIVQRQAEAFNVLLRALVPDNRFYTAKFKANDSPAQISQLGELSARFPFTTKPELVADQAALPPYGSNLTCPLGHYTRCHQTSGTSGAPLRWLDTPESWENLLQNWFVIFNAGSITSSDTAFFAFSFGPFIGFWLAFEAAQRVGLRCIAGGGMSSIARLRNIFDHGATVLFSTPTYALHLAEVAQSHSINLAESPVRTIVVAGEPGGSIPATRQRILEAWPGARLVDHHGMTEVGPVSFACPARADVLHIIEGAYVPEIIDPVTGQAAAKGESGELVLTTLHRTGSPLVRYRTGDRVQAVIDDVCACGRSDLALAGGILGRIDEMVIVRGVNIYPEAIEAIVRSHPAVAEYQVRLRETHGLPEIEIDIEPTADAMGAAAVAVHTLEAALESALSLRIPVRAAAPGTLPRFEMKARRWIKS